MDPSTEISQRLKTILQKTNEFVTQRRISLVNVLSPHENAGGLIPYDTFYMQMKQQGINVPDEDLRFICENYLVIATSVTAGAGTLPRNIDYRKFLNDLKLHGQEPFKSLAVLTKE